MTSVDLPTDLPSDRELATVETVAAITAIADADAIELAHIRGWGVVVKKGEFAPGDLCIYLEVDSLVDVGDPRFAFLAARGVRTDATGRAGHVLKTVRLRGHYSQGLALPVAAFPELGPVGAGRVGDYQVGADVTGPLGVICWEPPVPASLAGRVRGSRPSWIPATDERRIQNLAAILAAPAAWQATEKLDGTSTTFWVAGRDDQGVCSRNLDLLADPAVTSWRLAGELGVHDRLRASGLGRRVALQGELYGEGISANPLRIRGQRFAAFTLLVDGVEVPRGDWPAWILALSVPVRDLAFPATVADALAQVDSLPSAVPARAGRPKGWCGGPPTGPRSLWPTAGGCGGRSRSSPTAYLLKNDR